MLPFEPESEISLKYRYKDAVKKSWDVNKVTPDIRPGLLRKHVFDFHDGLRLVVSRDMDGPKTYVHYSASMNSVMHFNNVGKFVSFVIAHINSLRDKPLEGTCNLLSTEKGILHLMHDETQPNQFEGLRPIGDPRWN